MADDDDDDDSDRDDQCGKGDGPDGVSSVTTADQGGTNISLTDILLSGVTVHFLVDSTETPAALLTAMRNRPAGLSSDNNSIIVTASGSFNALADSPDSAQASIMLPIAKYTGIKLDFPRVNDSLGQLENDSGNAQILMKGAFPYNGQTHPLRIRIAYPQGPCDQSYLFAGGVFTLSSTDTLHLELRFNANQWFSEINMSRGLDNGDYSFDDGGALEFTNFSGQSPVASAGADVANDFLTSGTLVIY